MDRVWRATYSPPGLEECDMTKHQKDDKGSDMHPPHFFFFF